MTSHVKRLGILGGGQLGRMSAQAATQLGIQTIIYTDSEGGPASQVAFKTYVGDYTDQDQLKSFAQEIDVISYEFENIPLETVQFLKTLKPVYPNEALLEISQHRVLEKSFLNKIGIPTARWKAVSSYKDVQKILEEWNVTSCIIKTSRFGYDGKGQGRLSKEDDVNAILQRFGTDDLIAEDIIDFDYEVSVIVARDVQGQSVFYGPLLNKHKNHILDTTCSPVPDIDPALADKACQMADKIADELDLRGVLTLELFVTKDGELLANEIAPRTHNSGHYSLDACEVSQFENHVRAVCGLDVKEPRQHSHAKMINLIGEDVNDLSKYLEMSHATIHLYGKDEVKSGRKMGHVNILGSKLKA